MKKGAAERSFMHIVFINQCQILFHQMRFTADVHICTIVIEGFFTVIHLCCHKWDQSRLY